MKRPSKSTTTLIAVCWVVIGVVIIFFSLLSLFIEEGSRSSNYWSLSWGIASLIGAIGLSIRRAFGWWVIVIVNGLAVVWMTRCFINNMTPRNHMDIDLVYAILAMILALCVWFITLLLDRPSRWVSQTEN